MKIKNKTIIPKRLFLAIFAASLFFGTFLFASNSKAETPSTYSASSSIAGQTPGVGSCILGLGKIQQVSSREECGFLCANEYGANNDPRCNYQDNAKSIGAIQQGSNLGNDASTNPAPVPAPKKFNYILLETFPGFFTAGSVMTDLPGMILAIYKFGIWTVGIAGLFMLVVGGFMYMTSAGNTSTASSARGIIWDALLGIVAALGAYLILYVINPNLTKISLDFTPVNVEEVGPGPSTSGSGNCQPITDFNNPCSVDRLRFFVIGQGYSGANADKWAQEASGICNAESGGKIAAESGGKCNGTPIAYGLFQVNLNAWCKGAFTSKWNKSAGFTNGGCSMANQSIFDNCKKNAIDPNWNLNKMWSLYKASGWKPWEVTLNGTCNF